MVMENISGVDALQDEVETLAQLGKTPVYVAQEGRLVGVIAISDPVKPDAKEAIAALKLAGNRVILLSGDKQETVQAVAD